MQATCGNCGHPVEGSDPICPYCGVLLAAYASPIGAMPISMDAPPPPVKMDLPNEVDTPALAPRSLSDTHVTVDELTEAADGDTGEPLLAVDINEASEPQLLVGEESPPENGTTGAKVSIRSGFWKELAISNYDQTERSNVAAYHRKLQADTESASADTRLTKPVDDFITPPKERSIIEAIFSWSEKEESEVIVGRTLLVLVPGAMLLQATKVVDFPFANLIIVLVLVVSFLFGLLKNLDS